MNILYIASVVSVPCEMGEGSGGSTHTSEVARHLTLLGHRVFIACKRSESQSKLEGRDSVVFYRMFDWRTVAYNWLVHRPSIWKLARVPYYALRTIRHTWLLIIFAITRKVDVVYERTSESTLAGTLCAAILRLPFVIEVNDHSLSSLTLRACRAIVTPDRDSIPAPFRSKVLQIEWGVDTSMFHSNVECAWVKQQYIIPVDLTLALFVGSGLPWHGLGDVLKAARLTLARGLPIMYMVVGGGTEIQNLRHEIEHDGLREVFRFTGPLDYELVPAVMAAADITLAPYNSLLSINNRHCIASPLKVLEYMASSKPVITTELANGRKRLKHRISAWIIPENSPAALADAIEILAGDNALRSAIGRNARDEVEQHSWRAHCAQLEGLFLAITN